MKTFRRFLLGLLATVVILTAAAVILVQFSSVQTRIANRALAVLSRSTEGNITVGRIRYTFFNRLLLKDVAITEPSGDTLFASRTVLLELGASPLRSDTLSIRRFALGHGRLTLRDRPDGRTNLEAFIAGFSPAEPDTASAGLPWKVILARRIAMRKMDFEYVGHPLRFEEMGLRIDHFHYGDSLGASLHRLSFRDAWSDNGYQLRTEVSASDSCLIFSDFCLKDRYSDIDAPRIALRYASLNDLLEHPERSVLDAELTDACLDWNSAARFLPEAAALRARCYLSGRVRGTLADLQADRLRLQTASRRSNLLLSARLQGLPDLRGLHLDATLHPSHVQLQDVEELLQGILPDLELPVLSAPLPREPLDLSGSIRGTLAEAQADLRMGSRQTGGIVAEASYRKDPRGLPLLRGNLTTHRLKPGPYLGIDSLGAVSADLLFDAVLTQKPSVDLKRLYLRGLEYNGYNYSDLQASGTYENDRLLLNATCLDPNLYFLATADLDLKEDADNRFRASFDLERADLHALNLDSRERARIGFSADVDLIRSRDEVFTGEVVLSQVKGVAAEERYDIGEMILRAVDDPLTGYLLTLESPLAEAAYRGSGHPADLVENLLCLIRPDLDHLIPGPGERRKDSSGKGSFHLVTKDLRPLFAFLLPGFYLSEGTTLDVEIDGCRQASASLNANLAGFRDNLIRDLSLQADNAKGPFEAVIHAGTLQAGSLILHENLLSASLEDNALGLTLRYDNSGYDGGNGTLNAILSFPERRDGEPYLLIADFLPSDLTLKDAGSWDIAPARLSYGEGRIAFEGFDISNDGQFISLDGALSERTTDTLYLAVNAFDIEPFEEILQSGLKLRGIFTGEAQATGLLSRQFSVQAKLSAQDLAADDVALGDADLECIWNTAESRFEVMVDNYIGEAEPFLAEGWYRPSDRQLNLDLSFDEFNVGWTDPFLVSVLEDMGGTISGDIHIEGPLDALKIRGERVRFNDTRCRVSFTNVRYWCNGPFEVDTEGIHFTDVDVSDEYGNRGIARGGIRFNGFKTLDFDILFTVKEMLGIDTSPAMAGENGFYGKAFGTGTVRLHGPITALRLDIDLAATGGVVHIPVSGGVVTQSDLLTFVNRTPEPVSPAYAPLLAASLPKEKEPAAKGQGLAVNIKISADPASEIDIDINEATGDVIRSHGNGSVEMNIANKTFDIKGLYTIEDGSYTMSLMGITAKDFTVEQGGTILFGGNILQTEFNMNALYRTKASIETLIGDNTSVSTRRTVNCRIGINGVVTNPQLTFKIDIPDLDPTTQGLVENALSTDEKNLKQTLALLVSGSFVPDEQSGIVNNSTILYSNASEIVSNQINNIFHQLDIPLDLGLNYQPGGTTGATDLFDVAISTQLFNNRVTINGNIGNQPYMATSASEVVGNVDMEIKLNKSGRLRLNLFSHAADRYSNYLDQTQRNGAGIVYQEEFDSIGELWRKIVTRPRRKPAPEVESESGEATR